MSRREEPPLPAAPEVSHLVCEDGAAVDSFLHEMQMRLLTAPLGAWEHPQGRGFLAAANVGVFAAVKNPALVPDVLVSFDVERRPLTGPDRLLSYFLWEFGKPPDIVVEIVSDAAGGELSTKLREYERMRVTHYVVYDPLRRLSDDELLAFSLHDGAYLRRENLRFVAEGLALTRWEGSFEGAQERWLRWTDLEGRLLPTPEEHRARADREASRADREASRADREASRADREASRVEQLRARLRELGFEPTE